MSRPQRSKKTKPVSALSQAEDVMLQKMRDTSRQDEGSTDRGSAIVFRTVGKTYKLYGGPRAMAADQLGLYRLRFWRPPPQFQEFRALDNVSFEIQHGERYGIVGRNGAGKTTLLRLITQNYLPTSGKVRVDGTVQALMQTGLGFSPEFSGAENIRASLHYNGLTGAAYDEAFADVVDFVELGHFLHQPLKTYSLGMQARVQFAASTAIKPDILIIDEILGAGDGYFATKSAERMRNLTESGCTLLLVSHSMQQVLQFCDKAIWLHQGSVRQIGPATEVVPAYEAHFEEGGAASGEAILEGGGPEPDQDGEDGTSGADRAGPSEPPDETAAHEREQMEEKAPTADQELGELRRERAMERLFQLPEAFGKPFVVDAIRACEPVDPGAGPPASTLLHGRFPVERWPGSGEVEITDLAVLNQGGEPSHHIHVGEHAIFRMTLDVKKSGDHTFIHTLFFYGIEGTLLARLDSPIDSFSAEAGDKRQIEMVLDRSPFGARDYAVSAGVFSVAAGETFEPGSDNRVDLLSRCMCLRVPQANEVDAPIVHWPATWYYDGDSQPHKSRISAIQ